MKIIGFETYQVTITGAIIGARGKELKYDPNSTGYLRVSLCKEGKVTRRFVHQLVAEHFCLGQAEGLVVNHIDGNITNNKACNLEWVTPSENVKDGYRRGRRNPNKYPDTLLTQLWIMWQNGYSVSDMSLRWGRDKGTIRKYVKQWSEGATTIP